MAATFQRIDFPNWREGWAIPPECWKSHYMFRRKLVDTVRSSCGSVERYIEHDGNGYRALWHEGTFDRCKSCQRIKGK